MSIKIILIRHGETPLTVKKVYCGITDINLNPAGKEQARKLALRMRGEKIQSVYSSGIARAKNFARLAFDGFQIETIPGLREMNFGIFEGLTHDEIMLKYPEMYSEWLKNPSGVAIPGGDTFRDFQKRTRRVLTKIAALNKDKIAAVVTHAGNIKVIIGDILKSKDIREINIVPASISIIEFGGAGAVIELLNDTSYLNE